MEACRLKRVPWVLLLGLLLAVPGAARGPMSPVQVKAARQKADSLRQQGDHAAFVQLRDWYLGMTPDEARQLEPGGPLEAAVAIGGNEGLDLAAQVMSETEGHPELVRLDDAVTNAMSNHASARALAILRGAVASRDPIQAAESREAYANAWAGVYLRLHEPHPEKAAISCANDKSHVALDRALCLQVLSFAVRNDPGVRSAALSAYRPYLRDPDAELNLAAVRMNRALWDPSVLPDLQRLANGSDPAVRNISHYLVWMYAQYGSAAPGRRGADSVVGMTTPTADPAALQAWKAANQQWAEEQYRLIHGQAPPPPMPPKPKMKLERVPQQPPAPPPGQPMPYRP
jgi:hypothetical protein